MSFLSIIMALPPFCRMPLYFTPLQFIVINFLSLFFRDDTNNPGHEFSKLKPLKVPVAEQFHL